MNCDDRILENYKNASDQYAEVGVDADQALKVLAAIPISLHCWQGDDVSGFEAVGTGVAENGIQATGNYPGKAQTIDQLRDDIEKALSLIPGKHRLNLHACYLDHNGTAVDRNEIDISHFQSWVDWAKYNKVGLDFNPTFFSHPLAQSGFTLSHPDKAIRDFWVEHGIACRKISGEFGKQLQSPSAINFWAPDGYKDIPVDRMGPRQRLLESLDAVFAEDISRKFSIDAVESKLFGIGAESYTVGSHEFYMGYALSREKMLCLDAGHFHPTENISEKISSVLAFMPELLLHVSRPVRWDSDHVVILNDELREIAHEIIRSDRVDDIHIGLDFFDASINRIAAWTIGTRSMIKALLIALLEPTKMLKEAESKFDFTTRLGMMEELKTMPFGAVWDYYCMTANVPVGHSWLELVNQYEKDVLSKRN